MENHSELKIDQPDLNISEHVPGTHTSEKETAVNADRNQSQESSPEPAKKTGEGAADEAFQEEFIKDLSTFEEGMIVEGIIVEVNPESVFVDIGYKSEGEISKAEFENEPFRGEKIEVMIIRMENREGRLVLSKQRADEIINWDEIKTAYKEGSPIEGTISERMKGGFKVLVKGSIEAFLPISQLDIRRVDNPDEYIGKNVLFKIDKFERKNNVVLSHRRYLEEMQEKKILDFFRNRRIGDEVDGVVKDIVGYGAFIDLGGIDGLLHTTDLSWGRVYDPKKRLNVGDTITCKILSMDSTSRKISLGLKQLVPDPWLMFPRRYEKGKVYRGTVMNITPFGAFIELEEGIEGLLHVSELSWTKRIKHPKEVLKNGEQVEVMLLDYDLHKKTVSLGLRQVLPNPWDDIDVRYPVNSIIKGKVVRITKFGAFIELEEGIDGLLHMEDMSWAKQVKNPSDLYKKNQIVEAMVISIDKENKKIKLGVKQLQDNPWTTLKAKHPKGSIVTGTVTSIVDFGVFVKVDEDIEGLIHISQLSNERVEDPASLFKIGDEVKAAVIDVDEQKRKVTLSIREYLNHLEEKEITKYLEDENTKTGSVTIGDLIDLSKIGE